MRRLTDRERDLAEAYWPEAQRIAVMTGKRYAKLSDVEPHHVAWDALHRAVPLYRADRGFLPLLNRCCRLAWIDAIRATYGRSARGTQKPHVSQFSPSGIAIGLVSDEDPVDLLLEAEDEVRALARKVTPREAEAVRLFYLHADITGLRRLGQVMGMGDSSAFLLMSSAHARLREQLAAS